MESKVYKVLTKYNHFLEEYGNLINKSSNSKEKYRKNIELKSLVTKTMNSNRFAKITLNDSENKHCEFLFKNKPLNFFDFYCMKNSNYLKNESTIEYFTENNIDLNDTSILLISLVEFSKLTRDNLKEFEVASFLRNIEETNPIITKENEPFLDNI